MDYERFQKDAQYASDWMAKTRDVFEKRLDSLEDFDEKVKSLKVFNQAQAKLYKHFVDAHSKTATLEFGAPMRADTGEHDLCTCAENNYAARLSQEDEAKLKLHEENQRHFQEREAKERHYSAPLREDAAEAESCSNEDSSSCDDDDEDDEQDYD